MGWWKSKGVLGARVVCGLLQAVNRSEEVEKMFVKMVKNVSILGYASGREKYLGFHSECILMYWAEIVWPKSSLLWTS